MKSVYLLILVNSMLLDPDPDPHSYTDADPDPGQPNQCGSGSTTLIIISNIQRTVNIHNSVQKIRWMFGMLLNAKETSSRFDSCVSNITRVLIIISQYEGTAGITKIRRLTGHCAVRSHIGKIRSNLITRRGALLRIRITLMRILLCTLMRIRILPFTPMRMRIQILTFTPMRMGIRILPVNLMRIRIQCPK